MVTVCWVTPALPPEEFELPHAASSSITAPRAVTVARLRRVAFRGLCMT
jgi:hypothetical protein